MPSPADTVACGRRRGKRFGIPLREITNLHLPLDALWGESAAELCERVLDAATPQRKLAVLERLLTSRLAHSRTQWPVQ